MILNFKKIRFLALFSTIIFVLAQISSVVAADKKEIKLEFDRKASGLILSVDDSKDYVFNMVVKGTFSIDFQLSPTGVEGKKWNIIIADSSGNNLKTFTCDDSKNNYIFSDIELKSGLYHLILKPINLPTFLKYQITIGSSEIEKFNATNVTSSLVGYRTIEFKLNDPYIYEKGKAPVKIDSSADVYPLIVNGRTLLPIRAVIEKMGGTITWKEDERKISIIQGPTTIHLWLDKKTASVNDVEKELDVSPSIIHGRTFVPVRFVAQNLGASVNWINETKTVSIEYQDISNWN